jgi:hypothetical protein
MNVRYVFFRNLNVAAAYGTLLFVLSACYNRTINVPWSDAKIVLLTILALLFALTSGVSHREALHSAVNHVREVFDSAYHFYSSLGQPKKT